MNILRFFGVGGDKIRANNCGVPGTVTDVSRCWWITINTKPVRRFSGDSAVYPSIITFSYQVDNVSYVGKLYIPHRYRVPQTGETIDVYYDPENPKKYACYAFGPAGTSRSEPMLKYPCLVLDHDDTVVQSEKTIGYPFFCYILDQFRPGQTITLEQFAQDCYELGFAEMCRSRWQFTPKELEDEYLGWMDYVMTHIPDPFPGIGNVIRRQKAEGGMTCVVSHSSVVNITRDYETHFGVLPDVIYGWDYPEELRKPNPFPLLDIMEKYRFTPDQMIVVDDMKLAWNMAHPLGVKVAFAGWGRTEFPALAQEMKSLCDYSFDSPKELERFLFEEE